MDLLDKMTRYKGHALVEDGANGRRIEFSCGESKGILTANPEIMAYTIEQQGQDLLVSENMILQLYTAKLEDTQDSTPYINVIWNIGTLSTEHNQPYQQLSGFLAEKLRFLSIDLAIIYSYPEAAGYFTKWLIDLEMNRVFTFNPRTVEKNNLLLVNTISPDMQKAEQYFRNKQQEF